MKLNTDDWTTFNVPLLPTTEIHYFECFIISLLMVTGLIASLQGYNELKQAPVAVADILFLVFAVSLCCALGDF